MIDVKKLITGFLILATAAVSSGLILALVSNSPTTTTVATPKPVIGGGVGTSGGSAFLPNEPTQEVTSIAVTPSTSLKVGSSVDQNNLTEVLATAFVNGVATANPNGPTTETNGNSVILHPDEQSVANQVASVPALANFTAPDWDMEAGSQPIKTTPSGSSADISHYSQALTDVVNNGLIASNVQTIVSNQNADPSQIGFVSDQMKKTLNNTLALPTPQPLLAFHKSLVKVMIYEKNELALAQNVGDDPVKTSLILQNEKSKYDAAVQDLQKQIQKASSLNGFSFGSGPVHSETSALSFFGRALGVQTANAQWLTFDASNFAEWIENFVKNIILQILKNTLTALIQKKVLSWVQGSGAPRFITNWGTTLVNSYQQSAISAINSEMSCGVYSGFIPRIKTTLGAYYKSGGNNTCANQFQASLGANTFQQFYDNFTNGGFIAYGSESLPSGNPYGGMFFDAQIVGNTARNAEAATLAKTTSANGQKGDQVCSDGSDPNNGEHTVCENPNGPDYTIDPSLNESCGPGDTSVVYANAGNSCGDGSTPTITTPGVFTGFAVNSAIDASPKLVTAANDIAGLLNSLLGSLLNSLASLAVSAGTKAINGGITNISPTTITGGGTNTVPAVALACNPLIQTTSSTSPITIGAVGGNTDANGNPPAYSWSDTSGFSSTGYIFSTSYAIPGTYFVTITDSTGDAPAKCKVIVQ